MHDGTNDMDRKGPSPSGLISRRAFRAPLPFSVDREKIIGTGVGARSRTIHATMPATSVGAAGIRAR